MREPDYYRQTSTALKQRKAPRRINPFFAPLLVLLAAGGWFALRSPSTAEPNTEPRSVASGAPAAERRPVAQGVREAPPPPPAPPCPYCGQDADRWRAFTNKAPPELGSKSAALIEASCGRMLFGYNQDGERAPASLTKMVAAMVATEQAKLSDIVDIKLNGWDLAADDDSTIMGLEAGMRLPVEDLIYGMLLVSGNDAALALSDHFGQTRFVDAMNVKVAQLGLKHTRFVTPDGRDAPGHYSSALDMALIGRYLLQNPYLAKVVNTKTYKPQWGGRDLTNINEMIYAYNDASGIKTGYTETADFTIVTAIERNGRMLIASSFGGWHLYLDVWRLLNWGFDNTPNTC